MLNAVDDFTVKQNLPGIFVWQLATAWLMDKEYNKDAHVCEVENSSFLVHFQVLLAV
jgi:hypothetical protein